MGRSKRPASLIRPLVIASMLLGPSAAMPAELSDFPRVRLGPGFQLQAAAQSNTEVWNQALAKWQISQATNDMTDQTYEVARSSRLVEDRGRVDLAAICSNDSLQIEFEYHAIEEDGSAFELSGNWGVVHVLYRKDSGDIDDIVTQSHYKNVADIVFSVNAPSDGNRGSPEHSTANDVFFGAQRNLREFLQAKSVRFQLPLADGFKEVIFLDPRDPTFLQFVTKCSLDLASVDRKRAENPTPEEQAKRAKEQKVALDDSVRQSALSNEKNAPIGSIGWQPGDGCTTTNAPLYAGPNRSIVAYAKDGTFCTIVGVTPNGEWAQVSIVGNVPNTLYSLRTYDVKAGLLKDRIPDRDIKRYGNARHNAPDNLLRPKSL